MFELQLSTTELVIFGFLLSVLIGEFLVYTAFFHVMNVKRVLEETEGMGLTLPRRMKLTAYFWLVVGYPADVWFNVTRGSRLFREAPKLFDGEWTFSARVQRHIDNGPGDLNHIDWRFEEAFEWAMILNISDPGHIDVSEVPDWYWERWCDECFDDVKIT